MRDNIKQGVILFMLLPLSGPGHAVQATAENNIHLFGALVVQPCVIPPGEENIVLEFGTVINKYLYAYQRTPGQPFKIHLTECDPLVAKTIKVTFSGTPSVNLPGMLAPDAGSSARGIAIGLETDQGIPLGFNKASPAVALLSGDNALVWQAYVQAEPGALTDKSLVSGKFTATATFSLDYE